MEIELEKALSFTGIPSSVHMHPNGVNYIYPSGCSVVIGDITNPHDQVFLRGHDEPVSCIKISKSGTLIASSQSGANSDVCIWDFASKQLIFRLDEHEHGVDSIDFSQDEKLLASVGGVIDNRLLIWDLLSGNLVGSTQLPKVVLSSSSTSGPNSSGGVHPKIVCFGGLVRDVKKREIKGKYQLATAIHDQLFMWQTDPQEGSLTKIKVNTTSSFVRIFSSLAFSNDGQYLYGGTTSGDFGCFHVRNNVLHAAITVCGGPGGVGSLLQSEKTTAMFVGGGDGTISIFSGSGKDFILQEKKTIFASTTEKLGTFGEKIIEKLENYEHTQISSLGFDGNEKFLLCGTSKGSLFTLQLGIKESNILGNLTKIPTFEINMKNMNSSNGPNSSKNAFSMEKLVESHNGEVMDVAFAPFSNELFATCSKDKTVVVWDSSDYSVKSKALFQAANGSIVGENIVFPNCLTFINDVIIVGFSDGSIRSVDAETGDHLWVIAKAHPKGSVTAIAASHNKKFIVSGGADGEVRVWDIKSKELVISLPKEHSKEITSIQIFNDDVHVLTASKDKSMLCWNLQTEKRISAYYQNMGTVNDVALARNELTFVSVGSNKKISYWDIRQKLPTRQIPYNADGGEKVPEYNSGYSLTKEENQNNSGTSEVFEGRCIDFSNDEDNKYFCVGGTDEELHLYDFASGQLLSSGTGGHSGTVNSLKFSHDNKQIISVADDCGVFCWNLFPASE